MLPCGAAGKLRIQDSLLKTITLKAIHVMSALLLQKPSKNSKPKDDLVSLERHLGVSAFWGEGDISNLLHEGVTIQKRMKNSENGMIIEKISFKFKNMMSKGTSTECLDF